MIKRIYIGMTSALFATFLIAYLIVWLSGNLDDSQYVDCYRAFVSGGLALSYQANKKLIETLNENMKRKTILYLPDFRSKYADDVEILLKEQLIEFKVVKVDIDINAYEETEKSISQASNLYRPDLIIAEGLGAFFIHRSGGINRICVNPDLHPSYRCDERLMKMYTEMENVGLVFNRLSDIEKCAHCWGIFGEGKERRDFSMLHYPNIITVCREVHSSLDVVDELLSLLSNIDHSRWTDEHGVQYAEYGRVLVKADYALFRSVEEYVIPQGVRTIQDYAFNGMNLKRIVIPDTVIFIGQYAFSDCRLLDEIILPPRVDKIRKATFLNCTSLSKVMLAKTTYRIETNAFKGTAIQTIELPHKNLTIESGAFDAGVKAVVPMSDMQSLLQDAKMCLT